MRNLILVIGVAFVQLISFVLTGAAQAQAPSNTPVEYFGIVIGTDGKPFSGAPVTLIERNFQSGAFITNQTATSDAQGKFHFASASPASFAMIRAPGFGVSGNVLQIGSAETPIEIKLKPPTELKLKFTDPDGKPVADMKVWPTYLREQTTNLTGSVSSLMITDTLKDEFTHTTDASGVCTIPGLPQGSMLTFDIGDDRFAMANTSTQIKLAAATSTDGGTIQLEPGGLISGKVTAADGGKPVAKMTVMAQGESTSAAGQRAGWIVSGQTDADGNYSIKKVRSGSYTMRLEMSPELIAQYAAPATDTFTITPGQELTGKDIALISGGIIKGKVSKAGGGDPIPNVRVYAYNIDNTQGRILSQSNAMTGADGTYVMHITPGQMQISISNPPPGYIMPQRTPSKQIKVDDGQTVSADFELPVNPNPPVVGHVVDEQGAPVAGASILLESPAVDQQARISPMASQAQTDKDGAFTIPGVADSTAIRARKGTMATLAPMGVTAQNRENVKITLHKDAVASVRIKLVDNTGQPIPGGQLMMMQSSGTNRISMQGGTTGPDGTDVISSLYLDTSYAVQAQAKGYGSGSINLSLKPGTTMDVSLALIKADSFVAGMVMDATQLPLPDTDVYASGPKSSQQTAKTDLTGHFHINNIVPGDTLTVYTRVGGRIAQQPPERVPAGTDNMILIHDPSAIPTPAPRLAPATRPAVTGRRGP